MQCIAPFFARDLCQAITARRMGWLRTGLPHKDLRLHTGLQRKGSQHRGCTGCRG